MANPILAIGVGGTGMKILVKAKERLIEAYGSVPRQVSFLGIDTQPYNSIHDPFCGVGLNTQAQDIRPPEYIKIVTDDQQNVRDCFRRKDEGEIAYQWVNEEKVKRTIFAPAQHFIKEGAGQIRPIGRMAVFLNYQSVRTEVDKSLEYLFNQANELRVIREEAERSDEYRKINNDVERAAVENELGKCLIFICGSNAGGTGSGVLMDIAHIVQASSKDRNVNVQIMGLIVCSDVFASSEKLDTSNGMSFLRELDRLTRPVKGQVGKELPRYLYFPNQSKPKPMDVSPFDNIFLFGSKNRSNRMLVPQLNQVLDKVVAPTAADFIVAHTDEIFAGRISIVRANWPARYYAENRGEKGLWPYAAVGTKTLIFPERDVRRSAGLRFLDQVFNEYLIPPSKMKVEVPPCTKELTGDEVTLDPKGFVSRRLIRKDITPKVTNVQFIERLVQQVITPSNKAYASATSFLGNNSSSLKGSIKFVGLGNSNAKKDIDTFIDTLESNINDTITDLRELRNVGANEDILSLIRYSDDAWGKKYLGEGVLGSEEGGKWDEWLFEFVENYPQEFQDVLFNVCQAILNDQDPSEKRILIRYRLAYARMVLQAIREAAHLFRKNVLEAFPEVSNSKVRAINDINKYEQNLKDGRDHKKYVDAWVTLANAQRDLLGQRLLLRLCDELGGQGMITKDGQGRKSAVDVLDDMLREWENALIEVHQSYIIRQIAKHNENRDFKNSIPVREYVTSKNLEDDLYQKHYPNALNILLGSRGGRQFEWQEIDSSDNRFFLRMMWLPEKMKLKGSGEIAEHIIEWACSSEKGKPFAELASPSEIHMAELLKDHYKSPPSLTRSLANQGADDSIVLQSFTNPDPQSRAQRFIIVDTHQQDNTSPDKRREVEEFYRDPREGVIPMVNQALAAYPDLARNVMSEAKNPRAATSVEVYLGYGLEDLAIYRDSMDTYWEDAKGRALHILKAEDVASEFELATEKELGRKTTRRHILHPEVVDLFEHMKRIDDFLWLWHFGYIKEPNVPGGSEFYLVMDEEGRNKVKLTNTIGKHEDALYGYELTGRSNEDKERQRARYRFYYALRNFVLYGKDLDENANQRVDAIDYDDCRDLYKKESVYNNSAELRDVTQKRHQQFLKWVESKDVLIHDLGIVLAMRWKVLTPGSSTTEFDND